MVETLEAARVDVILPSPAMGANHVLPSSGVRILPRKDQCCVYKNWTFELWNINSRNRRPRVIVLECITPIYCVLGKAVKYFKQAPINNKREPPNNVEFTSAYLGPNLWSIFEKNWESYHENRTEIVAM